MKVCQEIEARRSFQTLENARSGFIWLLVLLCSNHLVCDQTLTS